MFSRSIGLCFFLFSSIFFSVAQDCTVKIEGNVVDEASESPLSYVNVYIQELQLGTTTDDEGNFSLENICAGHYHFILSHIGCEGEKLHFDIYGDTTLNIALSHTPTSLGTVVIAGKKEDYNSQANLTVNRKIIEDNANQNLSALLENETGVHLIKNGNGISKPVVHGLYGNRLLMLNNGISQAGQQWGNDHSPEIDPFAVDNIIVLKGANAIEYGGGNLGSVVLAQPKRIAREPHLHGQVNYIFDTNGRGHTFNTRMGQYTPAVAWKINGTLKKVGDKRTADYFLNNTGTEEANFALQLEKSLKENLFIDLYASTFNTKLGILRGSHISNVNNLEQALQQEVPFYTEPDFSYGLAAPSQKVSHHFTKARARYFISDEKILELVLAGQLNDRKEFDIRRGDRSDIPALSLKQYTFNSELKYSIAFADSWKLKLGNQNIVTDNTNASGTGILPLIPDYLSWRSGLFTTLSRVKERTTVNLGLRYDYEDQLVLAISNTFPREVVRYENSFHNLSALLSLKTKLAKKQSISWNIGYAMRNPAVNELYSNGLHQGVSGIEEGDPSLSTEKALKNTLEYKWVPSSKLALNVLAYHQLFQDYIFLNPQNEIRTTIRGAFPVFRYEQTAASIYGLDLSSQFTLGKSLLGLVRYSYLRGQDTAEDVPLIFMPPNSLFASLTFRAPQNKSRAGGRVKIEDAEIEISNRLVFRQNHILDGQDFLAPPDSYNLVGLKFSTDIILLNYKFRCFVKADNLFNVSYRDYLNRQRYFADDLGLNISVGLNVKF